MDGMNDWVFPSTRMADAVKFRPASLDIFYGLKYDPWTEGGKSLSEFCSSRGERVQALVQELSSLPESRPDSDWEALPVYRLIDYLTVEHRQFLLSDLPSFKSLLEMPLRDSSGGQLFGMLLDSFHRFTGILRTHLHEEEERIFPAILKNDYTLRRGGYPEPAQPVAERILVSSSLLFGEDELSAALDAWAFAVEKEGRNHGAPKAFAIATQAMKRLERKIRAHGELERDRLYPIASRIESELSAAFIP